MPFWAVALVAATSIHAGFQVTVTTLVYPALTRVSRPDFPAAHDAHSRAITPLVVFVYGAVILAAVGAVVSAPQSPPVWCAAVATLAAVLVTATRAAPLHKELGRRGPEPDLVRSLIRADRVRTVASVIAAVAAMASGVGA